MPDRDCHICEMGRSTAPETTIYADGLWTAGTVADVPGWVMLWTNRHTDGPWELSADEASSFGPLYVGLARAVREACKGERVYLLYLGENALHFHAMLVPRRADAPPDLRGPGIVAKAGELADRESALRVAASIRQRLELPVT